MKTSPKSYGLLFIQFRYLVQIEIAILEQRPRLEQALSPLPPAVQAARLSPPPERVRSPFSAAGLAI